MLVDVTFREAATFTVGPRYWSIAIRLANDGFYAPWTSATGRTATFDNQAARV
jgi:hypothetical protein